MKAGLRIDVDTLRGTRLGVPALCRTLGDKGIRATFFFSVGPDNMGRHLWRLLRPAFFVKMMRTKAGSLYGWDILLRGTFWPGPVIGKKCAGIIRTTADAGHEIGLHSWDHHAWQKHIDNMTADDITRHLQRGIDMLSAITGQIPGCSAVPGWRCNNLTLLQKQKLPFVYNSDCRGDSIFRPVVDTAVLDQPQIPVTLPTYDELAGTDGITNDNYNDYLLSLFKEDRLNVLTIHAEVEGIICNDMFREFLDKAHALGISFVPLEELLADVTGAGINKADMAQADTTGNKTAAAIKNAVLPQAKIIQQDIPGREGWLACQAQTISPVRPTSSKNDTQRYDVPMGDTPGQGTQRGGRQGAGTHKNDKQGATNA